jgi:hypothetical protein
LALKAEVVLGGSGHERCQSYDEIIDFIDAGTTPGAVVAFRPSESVLRRVAELVERSKDSSLSSEPEDYLLEHIMTMAKARQLT